MKTQDHNSKAHDLFLLMFNLSQLTLKEKITDVFIGALGEIWPDKTVSYHLVKPDNEENLIEISASGSNYGYLRIDDVTNINDDDHSLLLNATAMLAVILKKNEQDTLLSDEKLHLQKLVDERLSAIKESEIKYRNIFENAPLGVFQSTPDGKFLSANSVLAIMMGYSSPEEMVSLVSNIAEQHYVEPPVRNKEILDALDDGRFVMLENRYRRVNGTTWIGRAYTRIVHDEMGRQLYHEGFIEDITERKLSEQKVQDTQAKLSKSLEMSNQSRQTLLSVLEDHQKAEKEIQILNAELEERVMQRTSQLEAANKELEAFSYSVSHDLRSPLRHINGFSEILVKQFADQLPEEARKHLNTITVAAKKMGTLIDDLLSFSRTGRAELKKSIFRMNKAVDEAQAQISPSVVNRKIDWQISPLPEIYGDYNLLRQVWINLIENAVKYSCTRENTIIEIAFTESNRETIFHIRDNGVGFDMKYADKLFGVFQRLHSLSQFEGTGIGLANVQRIILRHGGKIWAEAEPDKGASFFFSIPKYEEDKQ